MRPVWPELERSRNLDQIWTPAHKRFDANVLGPHFERLCRKWTWYMAPPSLFGDQPNRVASSTVADPANSTRHELDIVAFGLADDSSSPLLAIGKAKRNEVMGLH